MVLTPVKISYFIIREDLSGFYSWSFYGLYSDVIVQEREDGERGFELDITTETLI